MLLVKSFKKTFRKVSLTRCLPTTLASWSARNFSRSALSLSTTEAGPACFFRKPTIPSAKRSSEVRRMQKDNEEPQDQSPAHLYTDLRCKQLNEWVMWQRDQFTSLVVENLLVLSWKFSLTEYERYALLYTRFQLYEFYVENSVTVSHVLFLYL